MNSTAQHWDNAYRQGDATRSWFQQHPQVSLQILQAAGATASDSVIDVGGGTSPLVDALLAAGHSDITVLDISNQALNAAQRRLGKDAGRVHWLRTDLLAWAPTRSWDIWHDRAVLHFFTSTHDQDCYLHILDQATHPGSIAVMATFAPDGPQQCSGLPVTRYDSRQLSQLLGRRWRLITEDRQEHTTPAGSTQPFLWTAFRRQD